MISQGCAHVRALVGDVIESVMSVRAGGHGKRFDPS